jgi:hypothetical protein
MKHPDLAVIWVSNSKGELKEKTLRTDLERRFTSLEFRLGWNPSQLMERQQRAKEYASIGPYVA